MKKYRILILMAAALMAIPMTAKKRKAPVKKKKVVQVVVEPSKEEVKFEEMLGATQQITPEHQERKKARRYAGR